MAAKSKIFFQATARDVFKVITDFESYPEFIPEIGSAKIVEEANDYIIVDFNLHAGKTINYVLRFEPKPFEKVTWTYVRGDLKDNHGSWILKENKKGTEGVYELTVNMGMLVPKFVMSAFAGIGLPSILKRFKERVESGESKKVISLSEELTQYEKNLIMRYLRRNQQDIDQTAAQLSLPGDELRQKIKEFKLG